MEEMSKYRIMPQLGVDGGCYGLLQRRVLREEAGEVDKGQARDMCHMEEFKCNLKDHGIYFRHLDSSF
jgi:hypothetical protein